jgi:hypothetical protein
MLFLPIRGIMAIAQKISELIASESSEGTIKDKLLDLQMKLEMGQITPEEYDEREEGLLEMLEQTRPKNGE